METCSILSHTQRYAAGALFALALHQSQIHQTRISHDPFPRNEGTNVKGVNTSKGLSVSDNPELWIHEKSALLWPVFSLLGVDDQTWHGLQETAGSSSQLRHHLGTFLTLMSEEGVGTSSERLDKEVALTKAVDATASSIKSIPDSSEDECGSREQKSSGQEKLSNNGIKPSAEPHETKHNLELHVSVQTEASMESENGIFEKPVEEASLISYQRKVTVLYAILSACVADTTEDDKKGFVSRKGYDARHRVALRMLARWLDINWIDMEAVEIMVAYSFMDKARKENAKDEDSKISESDWDKWKRGGIIGAAALTGGALMAVTGGLAAPAIAQGLGALAPTLGSLVPAIGSGFAAAATATGSVAGSVAVAASFGAAGASLTGNKMAMRIGSLEEFDLKEIGGNNQGRLAVEICISGLAFAEEDFVIPWEVHKDNSERYALQWESKNLIALSTAILDWLTSKIVVELMKEGAMTTVLSTLMTALAWPATLVSTFGLIDNRWAVAIDRSDKAGKVLAEVLLKGLQGNRPVTLVGFSLGARVIFKCLQCLAESEGDKAGLVERVVILGAPISIKGENWGAARKMVAGRFVNAYSSNDWTLGITFRASLLSQGLAGIQPVDLPGVENVDVTQIIEGHNSYLGMTGQILQQLEMNNCCAVFRKGHESTKEGKSTAT
ncbi:hypothetical protein L6164_024818 [Bauhinia variegata]|uniref:Uncharacterized protein n=1 Tax=Bauhinia variegata TaxID=167791 RepID=A0ACB9LZN0_BAUVA|nr:hypothetical protein L6164_024818 [Bauhinia variegata]